MQLDINNLLFRPGLEKYEAYKEFTSAVAGDFNPGGASASCSHSQQQLTPIRLIRPLLSLQR